MTGISSAAHVEGGLLFVHNRKQFDKGIAGLRDGDYIVTVERAVATRSAAQNAYYHGVVVKFVSEETGYSPTEAHEVLKAMHLPRDLAAEGKNGRLMNGLVIGGSTTKLNKLEFIEYLERIVQWAAEELHVVIPDPDPEWRQKAMQEAA